MKTILILFVIFSLQRYNFRDFAMDAEQYKDHPQSGIVERISNNWLKEF